MVAIRKFIRDLYYYAGDLSFARKLMKSYQGDVQILMYHRVIPRHEIREIDKGWTISLERFEEQMKYISSNFRVIQIDEKWEKNSIIVTFDDGYKDNLVHVLPVLKKYKIPAIIYISTKFAEGDGDIWWYELSEIIERENSISISWNSKAYFWDLSESGNKAHAFRELRKMILSLDEPEKKQLLDILRKGKTATSYLSICLDWNEIKLLSRENLITLGAHTHSHCTLKYMEKEKAVENILKGKYLLEKNTGKQVQHFAYPYGTLNEAGEREYEIVKNLGFVSGVTTRPGIIKNDGEKFALPRIGISDEDDEFRMSVKLSGWNNFFKS